MKHTNYFFFLLAYPPFFLQVLIESLNEETDLLAVLQALGVVNIIHQKVIISHIKRIKHCLVDEMSSSKSAHSSSISSSISSSSIVHSSSISSSSSVVSTTSMNSDDMCSTSICSSRSELVNTGNFVIFCFTLQLFYIVITIIITITIIMPLVH